MCLIQALRRLPFNPTVSLSKEILGETTIIVTNQSQQFVWEGYGLMLDIEAGSLPPHLQECHICIKAITPSSVRSSLPYNVSLSSVIYWFQCEPVYSFVKPITIQMQHCSKSVDKSKFCILKADYHPVDGHSSSIVFEKLKGNFTENGLGSIKVNSFSLYGTGDEGSDEREYYATVAHQYGHRLVDIYFAVTWNIEPFLTVSKQCCDSLI